MNESDQDFVDKARTAAEFLVEPSEWKRYYNFCSFHSLKSKHFIIQKHDFGHIFRFVNINAVVVMTITAFVWGYYA